MRLRLGMGLVALQVGLLFTAVAGEQVQCDGPYKDKQVAPEELAVVLEKHRRWRERDPNGQQANLCGADLMEANLQKADLMEANLQEAGLARANLQEADLIGANLEKAGLPGANLQKANLRGANLQDANLRGANLQKVTLAEANLQKATLAEADLRKANLRRAKLQEVDLIGAKLQEADLIGADLHAIYFEPVSLPDIRSIAFARSLSTLQFHTSPQTLQELREAFKKAGYRRQEREITYALWHTPRVKDGWGTLLQRGESLFKLVMFEWPCAYGMKPGRPLLLLVLLMPLFAIVYLVALRTRWDAGIWAVWPTDRVHKHADEETPRRLTHEAPFPKPLAPKGAQTVNPEASCCTELCTKATTGQCVLCDALAERNHCRKWFPAGRLALYFSLLSAFHLGWRELNVGTWITRLQPREYTLRATGWVRTVSGVQSLLSVYLLALWVLTYFGRPFE